MLFSRDLDEINRTIKFANIYGVSLTINYQILTKDFNLEISSPKKNGLKIVRKNVTKLAFELSNMIDELQATSIVAEG